ncbi:MAG: hypothetical protein JWL59_1872 [Chthoniobacteraceae bacterium]|nr:hypothetical protein [Chthoniobacteraceae bacterium]
MEPYEKAAEQILAHTRAVYQPQHDYAAADQNDFKHLDLKWYAKAAEKLQERGFRLLGDQEDRTITNAPGGYLKPVMLRVLVSADGMIIATLYHPKPVLWLRILFFVLGKSLAKTIDFESESEDGTFVSTSNAEAAAAIQLPPGISMRYLPKQTTLEALYTCQRETLNQTPQKTFKRFQSLEEIIKAQDRMNAIKAAFRQEIGEVSREEIERSVGSRDDSTESVYQEIQDLRSREKSGL